MDNVEDIRRDLPGREDISRIAHHAAAQAALGKVSAIAIVTVLNGGTYAAAFAGMTRAQRMTLVGELEALKQAILAHDEERFFEKLPDR